MDHPPTRPPSDHLIEFLQGRSVSCPRCGYDLRDAPIPKCPECAEPLELRVGTPRFRFGWLILAMVPGCFSGVTACLFVFPIWRTIGQPKGRGVPTSIMVATMFGFLSALSVLLLYRARHGIMRWATRAQVVLAAGIWGIHILAFVLLLLALFYL